MLARGVSPNCAKRLRQSSLAFPDFYQLEASRATTRRHELRIQPKSVHATGRAFSTHSRSANSSSSDSPVKVSYVLGTLLVFGIGATSWGLYEFYMTLTLWPAEVRSDLRAGLRAKQRGDLRLAQRHLTRAWNTVQSMTPEALSPDPYMKVSGVAIVLAEVLEAGQQREEAYDVLKTALVSFIGDRQPPTSDSGSSILPTNSPGASTDSSIPPPSSSTWSISALHRMSLPALLDSVRPGNASPGIDSRARMRAVALALKLGDLAENLSRPEEEEHWLGFAVAEVLRIVRDEYGLTHDTRRGFVQTRSEPVSISNSEQGDGHDAGLRNILSPDTVDSELGLPAWVSLTKSELAAPMERLGAFYARRGKAGNAILLYRVASSLLVQPKSKSTNSIRRVHGSTSSIAELCQALQIENAHMALLMNLRRARPEDEAIQRDLPRVLSRAVHIYDEAVRNHGSRQQRDDDVAADTEIVLCDETYPAVLFNAGIYYEEEGQLEQAIRSYSLSYMALQSHGPRDMMQEALERARRLQRRVDKNAREASQTKTLTGSSTQSGQ